VVTRSLSVDFVVLSLVEFWCLYTSFLKMLLMQTFRVTLIFFIFKIFGYLWYYLIDLISLPKSLRTQNTSY